MGGGEWVEQLKVYGSVKFWNPWISAVGVCQGETLCANFVWAKKGWELNFRGRINGANEQQ